MQFLIRSARLIDAASPHHGQVRDVWVDNGLIRQIGNDLSAEADVRVIEADDLHLSAGWFDLRVSAQDPGFEYKEDLASVCRAAAAGGFTDVALLPNTQPVVDEKGVLGYVQRIGEGQPTRLHLLAAVTRKAEGEEFTDMLDLHRAGAVAFSDGHHPLQNPDLLLKTLQYLAPIEGLLMNRPEEKWLTRFGQMHEGIQSTLLGLKGLPALAEEMMIARDVRLLAYVLEGAEPTPDVPLLHFSTLSSAGSVALLREAKAQGLPVSCDVAAHQLAFTDADLATFDTNLKVNPPFRTEADVAALWEGLADGTIDAVVSDHCPQDAESKNIEFDQAEFGMIGLETVFPVLMTYNRHLPLDRIIESLTTQPRRILRLPPIRIAEGGPAALTLFQPNQPWTYSHTFSKSRNSPWLGKTLTGNVLGIINRHQAVLAV